MISDDAPIDATLLQAEGNLRNGLYVPLLSINGHADHLNRGIIPQESVGCAKKHVTADVLQVAPVLVPGASRRDLVCSTLPSDLD